jgi:hypothetical protein
MPAETAPERLHAWDDLVWISETRECLQRLSQVTGSRYSLIDVLNERENDIRARQISWNDDDDAAEMAAEEISAA